MVTTLAKDQKEAIDSILYWGQYGDDNKFYLNSPAGFGKSFTISYLLEQLDHNKVIVTAPTDQALSIVAENLPPDIQVQTIHSLMKFYPIPDEEGNQFLIQGRYPPALDPGTWVIIDEASMLPSIIFKEIENHPHVKWLFVGDTWQLPPVGEKRLDLDSIFKYQFTLYIPKRHDDVLFDLMNDIRFNGFNSDKITYKTKKSVIYELKQQVEEGLNVRYLGYHHRCINKIAEEVTRYVYEREPDSYPIKGEKVQLKSIIIGDEKIIKNNSVVTIVDCDRDSITFTTKDDQWHNIEFDVLGQLPILLEKARSDRTQQSWVDYWRFFYSLPRLSSPFVSTVHSAQGMSVEYIKCDYTDIKSFNNPAMLYTAATRASKDIQFHI